MLRIKESLSSKRNGSDSISTLKNTDFSVWQSKNVWRNIVAIFEVHLNRSLKLRMNRQSQATASATFRHHLAHHRPCPSLYLEQGAKINCCSPSFYSKDWKLLEKAKTLNFFLPLILYLVLLFETFTAHSLSWSWESNIWQSCRMTNLSFSCTFN